jgi:hypothetical protein
MDLEALATKIASVVVPDRFESERVREWFRVYWDVLSLLKQELGEGNE